jgi:hypothetical protein
LKIKNLFIAIAIIYSSNLFAQNTIIHGGLDANTKSEVSVKKKNNNANTNNESNTQEIDPWMVHLSTLHFVRAMFVVGVEHDFKNRLGIAVDAGNCFNGDWAENVFGSNADFEKFKDNTVNYKNVSFKNYYGAATLKYFSKYYESPLNGEDVRYYMGVQARKYQQNYLLKNNFGTTIEDKLLPVNNMGIYAVGGVVNNNVSTAFAEMYIGFGMLNKTFDNYADNSITRQQEFVNTSNISRFSMLFGYKRGFYFRKKSK